MTPDLFATITVIIYGVYVCINGLWTREFYRIQGLGRRFAIHAVFCMLLVLAGFGTWTLLGQDYQFGASYLAMPAVYLFLLVIASTWTREHHGRMLILATKNNMKSEETVHASFSDYVLFIVVHATPMVVPLMLFDI